MRALAALLACVLCSAKAAEISVFAASSLTDALTEVGEKFDAQTGNKTTFQFAGSQTLRAQIEHGAKTDVYISASNTQYEPLLLAGIVGSGKIFADNKLAIVAKQSTGVRSIKDLAGAGLKIVIADKAVPAGEYTKQMLMAADSSGIYGKDFYPRVMKNVVSEEPSVRQVVLKVQLGEADAAVVYRSDVTASLRKSVRIVPIPSQFNKNTPYIAGILSSTKINNSAKDFIQYLQSDMGKKIMLKWGFLAP